MRDARRVFHGGDRRRELAAAADLATETLPPEPFSLDDLDEEDEHRAAHDGPDEVVFTA